MRHIVLPLIGVALAYGQCNMCAPNPAHSPFPYGFSPDPLYLPPGIDTSLTIYFTFPDQVQVVASGQTLNLYPNYAIWVDSLRLDWGLITTQGGGAFAYNASSPSAGPIIFDQLHRYKQWGSGATDYANFVVYQNPGVSAGPPGQTPPIGCARVCIRTSATEGSDTLRIKVRVFIPTLGDAGNKDTTNLRPTLFGSNAWFDTTFRYAVVVRGGRCNRCAPNAANSPFPHGFSPGSLQLPPGIDTSLTIYFTFPDSVRVQVMGYPTLVYPNYAIWVDSLRLDRGLITTQDGLTFAYNGSDPSAGPIIFDQLHRYKQWGSGATDYANFVVYRNPGTSAGPAGQTPPIGCARVCIRTSPNEGSDTLRIKVRAFFSVYGGGDYDYKDTTNLRPTSGGNNYWFDTTFRYPVVVRGRCNRCAPNAANSPFPHGFRPDPLQLPPSIDTSLVIYFTFPDSLIRGGITLYPNYAIWVDSLRLDRGLITDQYGDPFAYNASNPAGGSIHFDQRHRYKQWGSGATDYANFVIYQNPGTSAGPAGGTPPIGCARVCIRTSFTTGSDTLRMKVRAFVPATGDEDNKDTTNLRPTLFGLNAWLDTVFRYAVVISSAPASLGRGMSAMYAFRPMSNPAYREAVVTYTLHQPMAVRLRAYTLDGREVLLRDLGLQPAGTFQETLNLPAGQYFLRLETPYGLSATRLTVIE